MYFPRVGCSQIIWEITQCLKLSYLKSFAAWRLWHTNTRRCHGKAFQAFTAAIFKFYSLWSLNIFFLVFRNHLILLIGSWGYPTSSPWKFLCCHVFRITVLLHDKNSPWEFWCVWLRVSRLLILALHQQNE